MREEQRPAFLGAHPLPVAVIGVGVGVVGGFGPALAVRRRRHRIRRRGNRQEIGDHAFVVALDGMVHLPAVGWETSASRARRPASPGDTSSIRPTPTSRSLCRRISVSTGSLRVEVLPHCEHALHEVRGLDEVAAVVVLAERLGLAGAAENPVRPGPVVTRGPFVQEGQDLQDPLGRLGPRDESPLGADADRHQAHAGAAGGAGVGAVAQGRSLRGPGR